MKRIIAVLLSALVLSTAVMTGCGQSSSSSSSQSSAATEKTATSATSAASSKSSGSESSKTDSSAEESSVAGGWNIDEDVKPVVTKEQNEEFRKSINSFDSLNMEPVALLAQQVVKGTYSAFLCLDTTVADNPVTTWDIAVTYTDLYGKAKLTSIIEVHPDNVKAAESAGEALVDSWETVEITEGAVLEDSLKEALDSVMTKEYTPITVLGTQVVSGTNYVLLVQEKEDGKPVNYVVELNVDSEGKAELVKEAVFDLNYYLSIYN